MSDEKEKPSPAKWPFDPMQPGDHEPVKESPACSAYC